MGYHFENATDEVKLAVWQKGRAIPGYDAAVWRYDTCGSPIRFSDHGNSNSSMDGRLTMHVRGHWVAQRC